MNGGRVANPQRAKRTAALPLYLQRERQISLISQLFLQDNRENKLRTKCAFTLKSVEFHKLCSHLLKIVISKLRSKLNQRKTCLLKCYSFIFTEFMGFLCEVNFPTDTITAVLLKLLQL